MIRLAQRRIGLDPEGRVAFRVADAADLPYEDDSFDLVAQLNMPPFFAETARVLRPGGYFVIAATFGPATPFYTPESVLRRGFARVGLEQVESGGAGDGTYWVARRPGRADHSRNLVLGKPDSTCERQSLPPAARQPRFRGGRARLLPGGGELGGARSPSA